MILPGSPSQLAGRLSGKAYLVRVRARARARASVRVRVRARARVRVRVRDRDRDRVSPGRLSGKAYCLSDTQKSALG